MSRSAGEHTRRGGEDSSGERTDDRPSKAGEVATIHSHSTAPPRGGAVDNQMPRRTRVQILRLTLVLNDPGFHPIQSNRSDVSRRAQLLKKKNIAIEIDGKIR